MAKKAPAITVAGAGVKGLTSLNFQEKRSCKIICNEIVSEYNGPCSLMILHSVLV